MLVGLGLGPGDTELLTLRAVRRLSEAVKVFVPGRIAAHLVSPYCTPTILEFPMTGNEDQIRQCLVGNCEKIAPIARRSLAVIGILGDPNFYSTYARLCAIIRESHPDIVCVTEPGVSAITAFASVAGISLSGGFTVSDGGPPRHRIVLKVRRPREAVEALKREGYRHFVLVERMYMDGMRILRDQEIPEESDYMSILYAGT
ncbi:MAG: cobalt-factor II C(20)-methyltransferase [Methanomicrobiales archaeon]|nr:cobalt-factor II C(20)-methyltransferase [Methanomicrobiales archaeon]